MRRRVWVRSCSTAPARNVSQAAIRTLKPFSMSQNEICTQQQQVRKTATQPNLTTPVLRSGIPPYLGQVGGFPDAVDAAEGHDVGPAVALGVHDIAEHVHTALGLQDLHQGLLQSLLHCRGHRWEKGMETGYITHREHS